MDTINVKTGTAYTELVEAVQKTNYAYIETPLSHDAVRVNRAADEVVSIALSGDDWRIYHDAGIEYLAYRMDMPGAWLVRMAHFDAETIQRAVAKTIEMRKMDDQKVILVEVDNVVYGVLSRYIPMQHKEIFAQLEANGMNQQVRAWSLSPLSMRVFVGREADWNTRAISYGCTIENGTTGVVALGWRRSLITRTGKVFDFIASSSRVRHLKSEGIEGTMLALSDALDDAKMKTAIQWMNANTANREEVLKILALGPRKEKDLRDKWAESGLAEFFIEQAIEENVAPEKVNTLFTNFYERANALA